MKTRIISGVVMIIITAAVIAAGTLINPLVITAFIAFIAAVAIYELLHNAAGVKSKAALIGAGTYVALMVFAIDGSTGAKLQAAFDGAHSAYIKLTFTLALSVIYFIYSAAVTLKNHKSFTLSHIAFVCGMPIPIAFAFSSLGVVINHEHGLYYLFMLLNFSSICDMGAYFVGSTLGKHKLCPNISPHKTVEGAVGGIVSSIIVTYILGFSFSFEKNLTAAVILTVPFCILGMIGDLFASAIKRAAGIKDYGTIIPGHGGILDRFDSIIMTAPLLYLFIALGVI